MRKLILIIFAVGLLLLSGCMSGAQRVEVFDMLCKEKNMNYSHSFMAPICIYECEDSNNKIHKFILESCR